MRACVRGRRICGAHPGRALFHSLTRSFTRSLAHSLARSLIHSLARSFALRGPPRPRTPRRPPRFAPAASGAWGGGGGGGWGGQVPPAPHLPPGLAPQDPAPPFYPPIGSLFENRPRVILAWPPDRGTRRGPGKDDRATIFAAAPRQEGARQGCPPTSPDRAMLGLPPAPSPQGGILPPPQPQPQPQPS